MDVAAKPIQLHVGLQYICRVHGLTPHSSTSRCPYELIREGPPASLFPQLTKSTQKVSELTAVRQSIGRPGRKTAFSEGDHVVVFDFKTKLSARGVVKKVLGNNTYTVDCGKGPQHVSGDALSKSSLRPEDIDGGQQLTADHGQESSQARQDSTQVGQDPSQDSEQDTVTEPDSSSDEDDYIQDIVPAAMPRRRRRVRQEYLGPVCPNRLRQRI